MSNMLRDLRIRIAVFLLGAIGCRAGALVADDIVTTDSVRPGGVAADAIALEPILDLEIIDCHTHFYDPSRPEGVPWPSPGSALYRTVLPQHLRALPKFRPVTGTIIVEASSRVADNTWLLNLAKDDPFIVGIIGRLQVGTPKFDQQLRHFAANPLFRGIRVSVRQVQEALRSGEFEDFQALSDHGMTLDVNGGPETPSVISELAEQLPELRIVLNHIGNVRIDVTPPPAAWQTGIRAAAAHDNIYCKISALVEGARRSDRPTPTALAYYQPYLDVVWNAFGDHRVIYGSNWPVSERAADYATLQRIVLEYAFSKGEEATRKFCAGNAREAYKWVDREGRVKPAKSP